MNWIAFGSIIGVWVFQAGVTYAGFIILKGQMAESLAWQKNHGKEDDRRFMLVVGMVAVYVPDEKRDRVMELIEKFTSQ